MNILVVGGAGYLGGAITDTLSKSNHDFIVYDNLLYEEIYRKPVPFIYGDVRDKEKLKPLLEWADTIIWIAALVGDGACAIDKQLAKEVNTDSVKWLVDNFKKRIIFTSSASVYGASDGLLNENSRLNPLSHYAITKVWAEEILKDSNTIIFRLGTLFGNGDLYSRIRTDLVLNTLVLNAHAKGRIDIFGGNQWRPLLHVRDVAKLIYQSIESDVIGIHNAHYKNITMVELANLIKKYFNDLEIKLTETKFEDCRNYKITSEKAVKNLNFNPTITLEEGIIELKKLLDEKRIVNPFSNRYHNYNYLNDYLGGQK